jgi:hypothetical protein
MTGSYSTAGVTLAQAYWINQPAGYTMVNLTAGPPSNGGTVLNGDVVSPGCATFSVTK